jgi:hypothetical protein
MIYRVNLPCRDQTAGTARANHGAQTAEPLGHLTEVVVANPMRRGLQRGRPLACLHCSMWQRALMSRVEPRPAVERTELGRSNAQ